MDNKLSRLVHGLLVKFLRSFRLLAWRAMQLLSGQGGMALTWLLFKHSGKDGFDDIVWDDALQWFTPQTSYSIKSLKYLAEPDDSKIDLDSNLVIVLVEKRLLDDQIRVLKQPIFNGHHGGDGNPLPLHAYGEIPPPPFNPPPRPGNFNLRLALQTLRADINVTPIDPDWSACPPNYTASIIVADVYAGEAHRDGQTVLALREFLRDVKKSYKNLRGVILVGAFPEALLCRRWGNSDSPEEAIMAYRSEIVLGDLNGNWEQLYHDGGKWQDHFLIDDVRMVVEGGGVIHKKVGGKDYPTWDLEVGHEDMSGTWDPQLAKRRMNCRLFRFPLATSEKVVDENGNVVNKNDITEKQGKYYRPTGDEYGRLYDLYQDGSKALNESGVVTLENPIAFPEILVSRVNARNIARSKDQQGWYLDPYLERELLIAYFKRDHLYRTGELKHRGSAAIACNRPDEGEYGCVDMRSAFSESEAGYKDIQHEPLVELWQCKNVKKQQFRLFLDQPAILRSMLIHGDFTYLLLRDGNWEFTDWRDRWDQRDPNQTPAVFYWNTACYSNAPFCSDRLPYNAEMYGSGNPSECLLFYGDGLGVISQAHETGGWPGKFPDAADQPSPPGGAFERTLRARRTFGETWRAIYEEDRNNPTLQQTDDSKNDAVRKTAYIYNVTGDWTLRLNKR